MSEIHLKSEFRIQSVKQWPGLSSGAWAKNLVLEELKKHVVDAEYWLDQPRPEFNHHNAVHFVQTLMKPNERNVESYADAWYRVLCIVKEIV